MNMLNHDTLNPKTYTLRRPYHLNPWFLSDRKLPCLDVRKLFSGDVEHELLKTRDLMGCHESVFGSSVFLSFGVETPPKPQTK